MQGSNDTCIGTQRLQQHNSSYTDMNMDMNMDMDSMEFWGNPSSVIEVLLHKEKTTYAQHDYFARSAPVAPPPPPAAATNAAAAAPGHPASTISSSIPVDPTCRNVMAKWCIGLCKFCNYDPSMIASVVSCVDRFVATPRGSETLSDRDDYQLAVMAAMYLVTKIQQTQALEPASMVKLSRGKYSIADIEAMELEILIALKWCVNPPTVEVFADEFVTNYLDLNMDLDLNLNLDLELVPNNGTSTHQRIVELVRCQIREAVGDYELSCLHRPSHVAFGALVNALESLDITVSDLESVTALREMLEINDHDDGDELLLGGTGTSTSTSTCTTNIGYVSAALLRIVSSSEERSHNSSSALLVQRCCSGLAASSSNDNNNNSDSSNPPKGKQQQQHTTSTDPTTLTRTASSCVHSSPRGVVGDIHC